MSARRVIARAGDVAFVIALLGAVLARALPEPLQDLLSGLLLFWAPGYLLAALLRERLRAHFDGPLEFHGVALGLSLTALPLLALPLFLAHALSPETMASALAALLLTTSAALLASRLAAPPGNPEAHRPPLQPRPGARASLRAWRRSEKAMLALLVLLVVGTVGAVAVRLPDLAEPRGTEFFVTDTEGALPAVPLNATPGEPLALRVHVVEHREPRAFSVAAAFEGQAGRAGSWNLTATPEQETTLAIAVPAPAAPGSAWLDLRLLDENGHELRSLRLLLDVERP